MELIVGCVTRMPQGYSDRHFTVKVRGENTDGSSDEPEEINLHYLKEDLQSITVEFVDEITFILDDTDGGVVYMNDTILEELKDIVDVDGIMTDDLTRA